MKKHHLFRKLIVFAAAAVLIGALALFAVNLYMRGSSSGRILTEDELSAGTGGAADCILVLGCGVRDDGTPTPMLRDRMQTAVELYRAGAAPKLLVSGDHGKYTYDEVNAMKQYAIDAGVPSSDIFMDHAGFSTYETMYRARAVFGAERVLVVTQEYHLYRALYLARALGLEAYGVAADQRAYPGAAYRECREILARNKDFLTAIFQPQPTYLGDMIPVSGDGDQTNDT